MWNVIISDLNTAETMRKKNMEDLVSKYGEQDRQWARDHPKDTRRMREALDNLCDTCQKPIWTGERIAETEFCTGCGNVVNVKPGVLNDKEVNNAR